MVDFAVVLVRLSCDTLRAQKSLRARCPSRPALPASTLQNQGCLEECAFRGDCPDLEEHRARKLGCAGTVRAGARSCGSACVEQARTIERARTAGASTLWSSEHANVRERPPIFQDLAKPLKTLSK